MILASWFSLWQVGIYITEFRFDKSLNECVK